jgi:hypothetical protein
MSTNKLNMMSNVIFVTLIGLNAVQSIISNKLLQNHAREIVEEVIKSTEH